MQGPSAWLSVKRTSSPTDVPQEMNQNAPVKAELSSYPEVVAWYVHV